MNVIIDTNIWISFLIGHHLSEVRRIVSDDRFNVVVCSELLTEIVNVANRDKIRKYISPTDVAELLRIIDLFCKTVEIVIDTISNVRDAKDLYLLSLAESIDALYLVTGDADLKVLGCHKNTKIITLAEFKAMYLS